MKTLLALIALSAAATSLAAPTTPTILDAKPSAIVDLLKNEGYKPEFKPGDDKTSPSITVKSEGNSFYLYFTGCKDGVCKRLSTTNGFERPSKADDLAAKITAWNAKWYSQAYEEKDGSVYLDASYVLTGGFTAANFLAWFDAYKTEYDEFTNTIY
ncbi:YbjN domain-containing protein [Deinococcus aetherius]|nr:YbjN domain-containing protein [Deinococcus aetherius]